MDETQDQATTRPASPGEHDGHRRPVRGKMWRSGDPLAPYTDKLDQRFNGGQATG